VGSLASGQAFQFMLQLLLPVLGGNHFFSAAIFWRFSFSSFSFMGSGSFLNNGQNKSDQLFTIDRLWHGHYMM